MKVSYVFPIINKSINAERFFKDFSSSDFYAKYENNEVFFVAGSKDEQNLEYLNSLALKNENIKLILLDGKFSYNRAFSECLQYISGDVTLLGDTALNTNDEIFEELMAEHEEGAGIVQVKKDYSRFRSFFRTVGIGFYNFFVRLYSGNEDIMNISSLELIDKTPLDVMQAIPYKANFLRNSMFMEGMDMRTVYIDPKTKTYKNNYAVMSLSVIFSIILASVFAGALIATIIINNIDVEFNLVAFNVILIFVLLMCLASIFIALSKHMLDVRTGRIDTKAKLLATHNLEKSVEKQDIAEKPKTVVKRGNDDRRKTGDSRQKSR